MFRFEPPQVPEDWEPNPNRVWDSKWDMQPQASTSSSTGSGPVPHEQWKKGISADEVSDPITLWFNLMKLPFFFWNMTAWILIGRDTTTCSEEVDMGLFVPER